MVGEWQVNIILDTRTRSVYLSLVLSQLDAIPYVDFDEKTRLGLDGIMYQTNIFTIKFPPQTLYSI
jgi:hypothetical protein